MTARAGGDDQVCFLEETRLVGNAVDLEVADVGLMVIREGVLAPVGCGHGRTTGLGEVCPSSMYRCVEHEGNLPRSKDIIQ